MFFAVGAGIHNDRRSFGPTQTSITLSLSLLLLAGSSCSSKRESKRVEPTDAAVCGLKFLKIDGKCVETKTCDPPPVVLDSEERCLIGLLEARGGERDQCLVECMKSGEGRCVGGGCWHMCRTPMDKWEQPPGWDRCE